MYCRPINHNNSNPHKSLAELQDYWKSIVSKTKHLGVDYKISISGGEPVTNKDFLPFIEWLKEQPEQTAIYVTSNGSASLEYYKRLALKINGLTLSLHSEHVNELEFIKKAQSLNHLMVRPHKSFHINVMDEFWNQTRIAKYCEIFTELGISHAVNKIDYSEQTREQPIFLGKLNLDI